MIVRRGNADKQKQTLDNKKIESKKKQEELIEMKTELIKKEYQDNLKEIMEQKMFDLAYKLKHLEEGKTLSDIVQQNLQYYLIIISSLYNKSMKRHHIFQPRKIFAVLQE